MKEDKPLHTPMSRKTSISKGSLMENFSESGDSSLNYEDEEDDDDEDESMRGNETLAERLHKAGYNYKNLLAVSLKKNDNNDSYATYNPPLIASLFDYVPPVINFVTQDEKSTINTKFN